MKDFTGRVAAITGAGSGIGRSLAVELARRGCHLAISDVNDATLAETVSLCEGHGIKVTSTRVDVADKAALTAWADDVVAEHGKVNLIFNNAGVSLGYDVDTMSDDDLEWIIGINFWGVLNGTRAFLPHLHAADEGHVVNISSVFGLVSIPSQSAYNAAKFGVRGFTDALRMELKIARSTVSSTTVHPGGIRTNIVRNGRHDPTRVKPGTDPAAMFDRIARTTPDEAAQVILKAVQRDQRRVVIGLDGRLIDLLSRLPAFVVQGPMILGGRLERKRSAKQ